MPVPKLQQVNIVPARQSSERPSCLVVSGGGAALRDWISVSWFFPDAFELERVEQQPERLVAFGANEVYFFYGAQTQDEADALSDTASNETVRYWRYACDEITRNRLLAPELYLGLRPFRWSEGEPVWLSPTALTTYRRNVTPEGAHGVAVVMRRINERETLLKRLERRGRLSETMLEQVVESIAEFHQRQPENTSDIDIDQASDTVNDIYLSGLRSFQRECTSFLDPYSQLALDEAAVFLEHEFPVVQNKMDERAKRQCLVDAHGALRASAVFIRPVRDARLRIGVLGRTVEKRTHRIKDVLSDVSAIVVDLEVRGFKDAARMFEKFYFKRHPDAYDEGLYRFYTVAESVRQARLLLEQQRMYKLEQALILGTQLLSLAFQRSLRVAAPYIIAVGGEHDDGRGQLLDSLAELMSALVLRGKDQITQFPSVHVSSEILFENLLQQAARALEAGESVILEWPFTHWDERARLLQMLKLHKLSTQRRVAHLFVRCEQGRSERLRASIKRYGEYSELRSAPVSAVSSIAPSTWDEPRSSEELNEVFVETSLLQTELARSVLREFERLNQSQNEESCFITQ